MAKKPDEQPELPGIPRLPNLDKQGRAYLAVKQQIVDAQKALEKVTATVLAEMKKKDVTRHVLHGPDGDYVFKIEPSGEKLSVKRAKTGTSPRGRASKK